MDCWCRGTRRKGIEIGVEWIRSKSNSVTLALPIFVFDKEKISENSASKILAAWNCEGG